MNSLIDSVLRSTVTDRKDLFGQDCTFISFEKDVIKWKHIGLQSSTRYGRIAYRRGQQKEVSHSEYLILKISPSMGFMKDYSPLQFVNEVFFYTRILPFFERMDSRISELFPLYYNSLIQLNVHSDGAVIVFENLQEKGFMMPHRKSFLDRDHLSLMLRKIGMYHAYSHRARQLFPNKFFALATRCMMETNECVLKENNYFNSKRGFISLTLDPKYRSKIENLRDSIVRCDEAFRQSLVGDVNNRTHVLCHGDYLSTNILFRYENDKPTDLRFVDLATWRFASPVLDVALVLYLHADQKMRDENWDSLIDDYYTAVRDTFNTHIANVPTKESILAEFKGKVLVAYLIASFFLPRLMRQDIAGFTEDMATQALENILKDFIDRGFV